MKHLPTLWETQVRSLGQEDLLEKEMATHSSILAWNIPWTEKSGGLLSMGSQRVRHDWVTSLGGISKTLTLQKVYAYQLLPVQCWSQLVYVGTVHTEDWPCAFHPKPMVNGTMLVAWNRPWWEYYTMEISRCYISSPQRGGCQILAGMLHPTTILFLFDQLRQDYALRHILNGLCNPCKHLLWHALP